mmetsp:Transcript_11314/g.18512  ORF Transcript_11314/g.18512 Transcript_11314/m.18512 type:complete len:495 (+) Transcript_11314:56-1540(+)
MRRLRSMIPSPMYRWPWAERDRHDSWRFANWAGNQSWGPATRLFEPENMEALQHTVASHPKLRAIGSTHSFSPLFNAGDDNIGFVSMRKMPRICLLDDIEGVVSIDAGTTYSELCNALRDTSWALPMTAALPHFSVAGAVATGTHGSSGVGPCGRVAISGLADAVVEMKFVGADGETRTVRKGDPEFSFSVVSLGMLGICTHLKLQLVRNFDVEQCVYGSWPAHESHGPTGAELSDALAVLPEAMRSCDAFSLFVDFSVDAPGMLILKRFTPAAAGDASASGEREARKGEKCNSSVGFSPKQRFGKLLLKNDAVYNFIEGDTFETTVKGRWFDQLHVWMKDAAPFGPQGAPELQFEHFVPLRYAKECLERLHLIARSWPGILYAEIRAVRADDQALSPYNASEEDGFDTLAISHGIHSGLGEERVLQAAAIVEDGLSDFNPKPHWGKLSNLTHAKASRMYGPKLEAFRHHVGNIDPEGKFSNPWLDEVILARRS